ASIGANRKIPVVQAVQAYGSDVICRAMESGSFDIQPEHNERAANIVVDSISVYIPSNGHLAMKNFKTSSGHCFTVTDEEIMSEQKRLSSACGLFSGPAAATFCAGFLKQKVALDSSTY
ncbi:MAG: pyridoxal-phosphate dependent enzyme, partial [SAR324 cluster bacterium]|nr:pyridoxal-phosphate dependent enzyme [SAR324 cluster bacterium]